MQSSYLVLALAATASAFTVPASAGVARVNGLRGGRSPSMIEITPGVEFDTIAREWRCVHPVQRSDACTQSFRQRASGRARAIACCTHR